MSDKLSYLDELRILVQIRENHQKVCKYIKRNGWWCFPELNNLLDDISAGMDLLMPAERAERVRDELYGDDLESIIDANGDPRRSQV